MTLELGRVTDRKPPFRYSALTRVWFSDTDAQGIVYYGRYLPYFDLARVEYHRNLGLLGMDIGEEGQEFVMRACTIEYFAPAVFDDLIEVYVRMAKNWYVAEVGDVKELRGLLTALRNIEAVFDAYRVTPS